MRSYIMNKSFLVSTHSRIRLLYVVIILMLGTFIVRLFYLQVVRYDYYQNLAQEAQLKRYEIPATRGTIFASDGENSVPLVLNERRYNIVADPQIITNKEQTATKLSEVLSLSKDNILKHLNAKNRYEILAKKQTTAVKKRIADMMTQGTITGIFSKTVSQRVYPNGSLASQVLGFVNDDGVGNYGIEQALNGVLSGKNGKVRALTDSRGVPLLASGKNVSIDPVDGQNITLTIDIAMQKQLEGILKKGLEHAKSKSGSALIMDPHTGAIKAMANLPTYDPTNFTKVKDPQVFNNATVSSPLEPGSIMKTLTTAAALDLKAVKKDQSFFDPSFYIVNGFRIHDIAEDGGARTRTVSDILQYSLNTGATWLLMQMGGGEINKQARDNWYNYMTNHFQFGKITNVEQGFEEPGIIPNPDKGYALNLKFANSAFGQGMSVTPLQMASAVSAIVNGGTFYQPTLIAGYTGLDGIFVANSPKVVEKNVVSKEVSKIMIGFMDNIVETNNFAAIRKGYQVGGKTGTAQVARPGGGYYDDIFNGTYVGYVGGNTPQYVIMVRVDRPKLRGYAGSQAAGPIFASLSNMLIDNFSVEAISR